MVLFIFLIWIKLWWRHHILLVSLNMSFVRNSYFLLLKLKPHLEAKNNFWQLRCNINQKFCLAVFELFGLSYQLNWSMKFLHILSKFMIKILEANGVSLKLQLHHLKYSRVKIQLNNPFFVMFIRGNFF